jgi:hypothetical protein
MLRVPITDTDGLNASDDLRPGAVTRLGTRLDGILTVKGGAIREEALTRVTVSNTERRTPTSSLVTSNGTTG